MKPTTIMIAIVLIISTLGLTPEEVSAASSPSNILFSLNVGQEALDVSVNLRISQNFTLLRPSFALPQFHFLASGSNASTIAAGFEKAIQQLNAGARVSDLNLEARSNAWSNATGVQWLNITINFNVYGVTAGGGETFLADFSWKSFKYPTNLTMNGIELNRIGETYLREVATEVSSTEDGQFVNTAYYANRRIQARERYAEAAAGYSSLDFSFDTSTVETWAESPMPLTGRVSRSFPTLPLMGAYLIRVFTDPETNTQILQTYGIVYDIGTTLVAPQSSTVKGNTVTFRTDQFPETMMGITILGVTLAGSGALIYERYVTNARIRRKPKRQRA